MTPLPARNSRHVPKKRLRRNYPSSEESSSSESVYTGGAEVSEAVFSNDEA